MSEGETVLAAALGASAVTGVFAVGGILMAQLLGRQATIASERRQTRVEERRKAVAPIRAFLDEAARASAKVTWAECAAYAYDENVGGVQELGSREDVIKAFMSSVEEGPSPYELSRQLAVVLANAPTMGLATVAFAAHGWATSSGKGSTGKLRQAIMGARRLMEEYIVSGLQDGDEQS